MAIDVKARIAELAEPDYAEFHKKLVPGLVHTVNGVRSPKLRALAKEIAKEDWRAYLETATVDSYEEILLQGLVIGTAKMEIDERLSHIETFIPKIDNWAVCDSFCTGLKAVNKHLPLVWDFLQPYLHDDREYFIRFGVVMLLGYYVTEEYVDAVLAEMDAIRHEGYYVKMAVAWTLSLCYVRFPEKTHAYLQSCSLDDFTYNKALQKTIESFRISGETKDVLRGMKRKATKTS